MGSWVNGSATGIRASFEWEALASKKRAEVDAQLPVDWRLSRELLDEVQGGMHSTANIVDLDIARRSGVLSAKELEITGDYSSSALVAKIARKELTSLEVTTAFCKRAAVGQQLVRNQVYVTELCARF